MKVIEKYLKNIIWLVFVASIFMGLVGEITEDILVNNINVIPVVVKLVEIIIVTLINILIIKNVADSKEKGIKFKTYANAVFASIIMFVVTWVVAYVLVQIKTLINSLMIWGILAVLMYILKVLLSFTIYIIVLEESDVVSSIICSIKRTIRRENILRILLYNIGFIVVLLGVNMCIKTIDTLLAVTVMEIANYLVFIANEILYLKCRN